MDLQLQSGLGPGRKIASYRRKLPRKAYRKKNIYLPTEVWVDVFCYPWSTRPRMGRIVPRIGNRWFGDQLQFYLHECGKHSLGDLYFKPEGIMKNHPYGVPPQLLEYPQTTMPENIKFCKSFYIEHFDNHVFNFFRRIQSVLTANTKLNICYIFERPAFQHMPDYWDVDPKEAAAQLGNARTILGHLLPFMDGIHKMDTCDRMMPIVKSFPPEKFHQIEVFRLTLNRPVQGAIKPTMEWLTASNEPKLLDLWCHKDRFAKQVLETIRKQFMEAKEPSTFAVNFPISYDQLPAFNCENAIGEQLSGVRKKYREFEVLRHQASAEAGDQLRQWVDGKLKKDKDGMRDWEQCITLRKPTIGDGRIFAMPDLDQADNDDEEDEAEVDKPCSSKKRRICK